jgi:lysophospholipase L1-like esterase
LKIIFVLSIILNILFSLIAVLIIAKKGGFPYLIQKISEFNLKHNNWDDGFAPYYIHKNSQFKILPKIENAIVFLGDSITDEGEWTELFANVNIKNNIQNRGISGDTTTRTLRRLDIILESQPRQVFLMVGINDLINAKKTVDETIAGYKKILMQFQAETPNTSVFIQSVLPVNNQVYVFWQDNQKVISLNLKLKAIAQEFNYQYIDIFSSLLDSQGELDAKYTTDGLHLNGQAYLVWKAAIEKYIGIQSIFAKDT